MAHASSSAVHVVEVGSWLELGLGSGLGLGLGVGVGVGVGLGLGLGLLTLIVTSDGGVHAAEERERAGGAHYLERQPTHRRRAAHRPR